MSKCEGCIFKSYYDDMGARTPICNREGGLQEALRSYGKAENCPWYISQYDIIQMQKQQKEERETKTFNISGSCTVSKISTIQAVNEKCYLRERLARQLAISLLDAGYIQEETKTRDSDLLPGFAEINLTLRLDVVVPRKETKT